MIIYCWVTFEGLVDFPSLNLHCDGGPIPYHDAFTEDVAIDTGLHVIPWPGIWKMPSFVRGDMNSHMLDFA